MLFSLIAATFLVVSPPVLSQSQTNPDETITVTAARSPVTLDRFGGTATIITAEDIMRYGYRSMTDVLRHVPGLHVANSGGSGAQTSIFIRGTESNHVTVVIDGQEVTDPAFDNVAALQHLQLNDVVRIEVLRGPYSMQYGSEAIGGVIYVTTRKSDKTRQLSSLLEYGSFDSRLVSFGASAADGPWHFSANISYLDENGESFTPSRLRRVGEEDEDDGYKNLDIKFNAGLELNQIFGLDMYYGHINADAEYDTLGFNDALTEVISTEDGRSRESSEEDRVSIKLSAVTDVWNSYWQVSYYEKDTRQHGVFNSASRGHREKFEWYNHFILNERLTVSAGIENELETIKTEDSLSLRADARNYAVYTEMRWSPLQDLSLSGGWRYDDPDSSDGENSSQLSISWYPSRHNLKLHAAYGTAFRVPTLSERLDPTFGNSLLAPEKSRGWETGAEYALSGEERVGITYFNNDISDLITYNTDALRLENITGASIEGLEMFFSTELNDVMQFNANYTITSTSDQNHKHLLRRPIRQGSFDWTYQLQADTSISVQTLYVGRSRDIPRVPTATARVWQGEYALVNVSARHRLNNQVELLLRANNVLDKEYEPVNGYRGEGASIYFGLQYISE